MPRGLPTCPRHPRAALLSSSPGLPSPQRSILLAALRRLKLGMQKRVSSASLGFRPAPLGLQPCCAWDQAHAEPGGTGQATAFIPFYLKMGIIFGKASPGLLTGVWSDTELLHTVPAMVSLPQAKSHVVVDIPKDTPHSRGPRGHGGEQHPLPKALTPCLSPTVLTGIFQGSSEFPLNLTFTFGEIST